MLDLLLTDRTCDDPSRCAQCVAHSRSICAALDATDLREFERLGREMRFAAREPLFLDYVLRAFSKSLEAK